MIVDAALLTPPRRLTVPVANRWGAGTMAVMDYGDPARPVDLVFSHANGFNAATYRSLLSPLSASLRIWAPDLRGHGASSLPTFARPKTSWLDHRDDLLALLEAIDGPPVVLAGHSMGGTASLLAAAERPERVSSLVLFDPVIWRRSAVLAFQLPFAHRFASRIPIAAATLRRRAMFAELPNAYDLRMQGRAARLRALDDLVTAGKIRYIAIAAPKRAAQMPDVPTVGEAGGPQGLDVNSFVVLVSPKGLPADVSNRIHADVQKVLTDPEIKARFSTFAFEVLNWSADEIRKQADIKSRTYGKLVQRKNISLE